MEALNYTITFTEKELHSLSGSVYYYYRDLAYLTENLLLDENITDEDKDYLNNRLEDVLIQAEKLHNISNKTPDSSTVFVFKDI